MNETLSLKSIIDTSDKAKAIDITKPLIEQKEAVDDWLRDPWNGPLKTCDWAENPQVSITDSGVSSEGFFFIDSLDYKEFPFPLMKLGCAVPVSILETKAKEIRKGTNRPIFRALFLNAYKLYINGVGGQSRKLSMFWGQPIRAVGLEVVSLIDEAFAPLYDSGVCFDEKDTHFDDAMSIDDNLAPIFPSNVNNRRFKEYGEGSLGFSNFGLLKKDPRTANWVRMFKAFANAKLSNIRGLSLGDSPKSVNLKIPGLTKPQWQALVSRGIDYMRRLAVINPSSPVLEKAGFAKLNCKDKFLERSSNFSKNEVVEELLNNPIAAMQLCRGVNLCLLTQDSVDYLTRFELTIQKLDSRIRNFKSGRGVALPLTPLLVNGKDPTSHLGDLEYSLGTVLSPTAKSSVSEASAEFIESMLWEYAPEHYGFWQNKVSYLMSGTRLLRNPFFLGLPETEEVLAKLAKNRFKLPPPIHLPSVFLPLLMELLNTEVVEDDLLFEYINSEGNTCSQKIESWYARARSSYHY